MIDKAKTQQKGQKIGADTYQTSQDEILFTNIINCLDNFFKVLEKNLDIIIKNSASVMRAEKQVINIKKSHKPQDLLKRKLQPHKKVTIAYSKVYDDFSEENKWLAYVVYQVLERLLDNQEQLFSDIQQQQAFDNTQQNKAQKEQQKQQLDNVKNRLRHIQQNSFLQKFKRFAYKKPTITTKLKKSKGYSAIFKEFQNIFNYEVVNGFNQYKDIQQAFASGYVDNLSNIYEYWCLFVIYDNLLKLGFSVQGKGLEDYLELQNNNLILPSAMVITLEKPIAQYDNKVAQNNKKIIVKLAYEPKLARIDGGADYTPDIKMDFVIPKRALGLEKFSIILDAKFKDYTKDNLGYNWDYRQLLENVTDKNDLLNQCHLISDIVGTAIYKYHNALVKKPDMSVILHPNTNLLWLGEQPLEDFFKENGILTQKEFSTLERKLPLMNSERYSYLQAKYFINYCVHHKFGLLVLRPNSLAKDISRLFTLIFQYQGKLKQHLLELIRKQKSL